MSEEAWKCAEKAIEFDNAGKIDGAVYFYGEAATSILELIKAGTLSANYRTQAEQYVVRAEELRHLLLESSGNLLGSQKSKQQLDVERAEFLLYQALGEDEDENVEDAINLYTEAIDLCLATRKNTDNTDLSKKLKILAQKSLERAELLKNKQVISNAAKSDDAKIEDRTRLVPPLGFSGLSIDDNEIHKGAGSVSPATKRKLQIAGKAGYTKEELEVLRSTSLINGREYVPFMSVDLKERFAYPVPFNDRDGPLALADKQKNKLKKFVRPEEYLDDPKVIDRIDSGTIKQTIVSDCSFIASLAIAARYEKRTGKRLVTSIIYPQNRRGDPVYNPCGKYMIKLHLNGVYRKVIIDDFLPMGNYGDLLCSYSQNRNELWVSLLEKAYMKVMGGYDFPGSNSNIDLHSLTGWIPERIAIRPGSAEFNQDQVFEKILDRYHRGDCLVTLATGQLPQNEQDRAGLVESHAYAMLDIRKIQGKRLLLVKNPWTHLRWKGKYSERDLNSWTPELRKALNYNPDDAQQFDDGIFWIDYESVCHFFDVFYLNWNPELFGHTFCYHASWSGGVGPVKDLYSMAENPQYSLQVNNSSGTAAVWILLTRHITDKADFANNQEYITVIVYKSGKKVYYPFDPPPFIDGCRINSPHYLCKMVVKDVGVSNYTLVVAQYEKHKTIKYSLRVYSTCNFRLDKIPNPYSHQKKETGEWRGKTAGGCPNYRDTYGSNPIYQISFDTSDDNDLLIDLKGPKQYSVGFDFVQVATKGRSVERQGSGSYRPGFCILTVDSIPSGTYNVIPTTFLQNQEGPFFLSVKSTTPFSLRRIQ